MRYHFQTDHTHCHASDVNLPYLILCVPNHTLLYHSMNACHTLYQTSAFTSRDTILYHTILNRIMSPHFVINQPIFQLFYLFQVGALDLSAEFRLGVRLNAKMNTGMCAISLRLYTSRVILPGFTNSLTFVSLFYELCEYYSLYRRHCAFFFFTL